MKIVYTVAGEGMGHAARAHAVIEALANNHDITIFAGDTSYLYLKKVFPKVFPLSCLRIAYHQNTALSITTILFNVLRFPAYLWSLTKMIKKLNKIKPDMMIDDFSMMGSYASLLMGISMLTIDNQHTISLVKDIPKKYAFDHAMSKLVVSLVVPHARKNMITSFFPLKTRKNQILLAPLLRKEIRNLQSKKGDHLLVYQTSQTNENLIKYLKLLDIPCYVYGFHKNKREKNIFFKKEHQQFLQDLSSAKAVIINGGFNVLTEALYLQKPILSIPVRHQFEQVLNAIQLEKLGCGMFVEKIDEKTIPAFLEKLPEYEEKIKSLNLDYEGAFDRIKNVLASWKK